LRGVEPLGRGNLARSSYLDANRLAGIEYQTHVRFYAWLIRGRESLMGKEIKYSDHLLYRLKVREFSADMPRTILKTANEIFIDRATGNFVAVGQGEYVGKTRELAVAFVEKSEYTEIITIHPLKPGQKNKRMASGRWVAK
jgi:hypothetical protein